jgi:hypothetical protein
VPRAAFARQVDRAINAATDWIIDATIPEADEGARAIARAGARSRRALRSPGGSAIARLAAGDTREERTMKRVMVVLVALAAAVAAFAMDFALTDGAVIVDEIAGSALSVRWAHGVVERAVEDIASVGGAAAAEGQSTVADRQYHVGDTGPAGGIVFYDKGEYGDGWRYLEAAPPGWYGTDEDPNALWSSDLTTIGASETGIGTGATNSQVIADYLRNGEADRAVQLCDDLVLNGYDDWFLPSKDELNQLYRTGAAVGGLASDYYWSSSEYDSFTVWFQSFSDGHQGNNGLKYGVQRVRPVRGF